MSKRINSYLAVLILGFTLMAAPAQASLVGQTFDFNYNQTGLGMGISDLGVGYSDPGAEIAAGDGSNIGTQVLLSPGSIDIFAESILFTLRGGGPAHSAGYQKTGAAADGRFRISGFSDSLINLFGIMAGDMFVIDVANMVGVALGSEVIVNSDAVAANNYIDFFIGTLGIEEVNDIGTVNLRVERSTAPPNAVPLPAALPLMLSALALIGFISRRRNSA